MTQGVYYIGLDLNKDRYFTRGVNPSDPLNLYPVPGAVKYAAYNSAAFVQFIRDTLLYDFTYRYQVSTGASADAGIELGADPDALYDRINVTSGTEYTVRLQVTGTSGEAVRLHVRGYNGTPVGTVNEQADITLTGAWQNVTVTITPDTNFLAIRVYRITTTNACTFYIRNIMLVEGDTAPTSYNTGSPSDFYNDITDYVLTAAWNNGMDSARQDISSGARCTLTLDNSQGYFNQDGLGPELVVNGDFSNWTGDDPDNWTLDFVETPTRLVSQVGFDSLYGEGGTGSCNFYSGCGISQNILTVGETYVCEFDIGASASSMNFYSGGILISRTYALPGHYQFIFVAPAVDFTVEGSNITFDNVSVKECPRYYGLARGMLVNIRGYLGVLEFNLYVGRLASIVLQGGGYERPVCVLTFTDAMEELAELEYIPQGINYNTAVQLALARMFSQIPLAWPYLSTFWILNYSVLNYDTVPFDTNLLTYDSNQISNSTILAYEGDVASNRQKGVSAASYARDVVTAEMGGRLFFNARSGIFKFVGRNEDNSVISVSASMTDDDYESYEYSSLDDIVNRVTIYYKQRQTTSSVVTLWQSENTISLSPGQRQRITGRYRDPNNTEVQVSASSTEPLSSVVDYTISPANKAANVKITATAGAQSVTFELENTDSKTTITVSGLQIRGVPIYATTEESVTVDNIISQTVHNVRPETHNLPLISDPDTVLAMASGISTLYGKAYPNIKSITFSATKTEGRYLRALTEFLGYRVSINQSTNGHDADYIVVGERHNITAGEEHTHTVTWILKPIERVAYWYLGQAGRSELGISTIPAF